MHVIILMLVGLLMSVPGCMMVREGKVRPPAAWPPQQTQPQKKSIGLSVAGLMNPSGAHQMPRVETIEMARGQAVRAYTESGLFSSVAVTDEPTDLRADIAVIEDGSDGIGVFGYLSALTFTMIPGYVSEDVIVKTSYTDRGKKLLDMVEKKEELGFWMQFFLLFTMPFIDGPSEVSQSAHYDIQRVTVEEAHSKGVF
jgi:hypothetical protein